MKQLLLSAIACPKCHGQLEYDKQHQQLVCQNDRLVYSIKEGIPVSYTHLTLPTNQSNCDKE